jgi:hypothetical protein
MFLDLIKISEDAATVTYLIETLYWNQTYMPEIRHEKVKAICIFDKSSKTITFDNNETDSYYFKRKWEPIYILEHLKKLHETGKPFPEKYSIITGG